MKRKKKGYNMRLQVASKEGDNMSNNGLTISELNQETIESMIYIIRGQKVMLDFELAKIYGYETKTFNQQVRRNKYKFPDRYRFQLTKDELFEIARSQNVTSQIWVTKSGGRAYLPYAFTEQGIYMLMTVLKGELATKQSIALIDAFKQMKDYIIENNGLLQNTNSYIESKFSSYDKRFEIIENKIDVVMDNFIDDSMYKHFLILNGCKVEADIAYQSVYKLAKYSIYIIDDYIDIKTLQLLKIVGDDIDIIVITDNRAKNNINSSFIDDFKSDTGKEITFKRNKGRFHDRYIVIDYDRKTELLYHCGASSKDSGKSINTICLIDDKNLYKILIEEACNNEDLFNKEDK